MAKKKTTKTEAAAPQAPAYEAEKEYTVAATTRAEARARFRQMRAEAISQGMTFHTGGWIQKTEDGTFQITAVFHK